MSSPDESPVNRHTANQIPMEQSKSMVVGGPNPHDTMPKPNLKRSYPKESDQATNHWKAITLHVEDYDRRVNKLQKLNKSLDHRNMSQSQNQQIYHKMKSKMDVDRSEKENDRKILSDGQARLKIEENARLAYKKDLAKNLNDVYSKQIENKNSLNNARRNSDLKFHQELIEECHNYNDPDQYR